MLQKTALSLFYDTPSPLFSLKLPPSPFHFLSYSPTQRFRRNLCRPTSGTDSSKFDRVCQNVCSHLIFRLVCLSKIFSKIALILDRLYFK